MLVFGMSTAFILLLIFLLKYTSGVIQLAPVLLSVSGFLVVSAIVGMPYHWEARLKERFLIASHFKFSNPNSRVDTARKITVGLLIILVVGSIGFAVAFPPHGEDFTEFSLLTEDSDGELVAADYPKEFVQQEAQPLVVSIKNQEYKNVNYTVIIQLERVEERDNSMEVIERKELDRFKVALEHDETRHIHHEVVPTIAGEELRLTYLLYDSEVPEEPSRENAYRDLHIWISVDDSSDEGIEIHQPIDEE